MRVIDEDLLDEFRRSPRCEWCGKRTPSGCDPAHVFARGMRSVNRLDIRTNLAALCRQCHMENHSGQITLNDLLAVVAAREGVLQRDIVDEVYRLRRTPQKAREAYSEEEELADRWATR